MNKVMLYEQNRYAFLYKEDLKQILQTETSRGVLDLILQYFTTV